MTPSNTPPGNYHHTRQKKISHFPQAAVFENLFSPSRNGGGKGNYGPKK